MHDLGLKTSIQTFDAFVRCTLMGNQPWPQFQNGIRERSIEVAVQKLGGEGDFTQPSLGSRWGSKTPWAGEG